MWDGVGEELREEVANGGRVLPWTESGGTINAPETYFAAVGSMGPREVGVVESDVVDGSFTTGRPHREGIMIRFLRLRTNVVLCRCE